MKKLKCGDLLFVIEGVIGESFHRVDLVFACEYIGDSFVSEAPIPRQAFKNLCKYSCFAV